MTESTDGSVVRLPGEGETVSLFGDTYTIEAASDETGAALSRDRGRVGASLDGRLSM